VRGRLQLAEATRQVSVPSLGTVAECQGLLFPVWSPLGLRGLLGGCRLSTGSVQLVRVLSSCDDQPIRSTELGGQQGARRDGGIGASSLFDRDNYRAFRRLNNPASRGGRRNVRPASALSQGRPTMFRVSNKIRAEFEAVGRNLGR
jgi:hypothetical protein